MGGPTYFHFLRTPAIRGTSAIESLSGPGSAPPALARVMQIVHVDSQRPQCVRKHRPRDVHVSARVSCACKMARAREDPALGDLAHGWPGVVAPLRNEGRSAVAVLFAIVRIAQRDCLVSAQGGQSPRPHRHAPPIRAACSTDTETPAASATGVLIRNSAHLSSEPSEMAPRAGLEPATLRLTAACSTIELPRNKPVGTRTVTGGRGPKPCVARAPSRTGRSRLPSVPLDVNRALRIASASRTARAAPCRRRPVRGRTLRPAERAFHEWLSEADRPSARG